MNKRLLGSALLVLLLGATTGCSQDSPNNSKGTSTAEAPLAAPKPGDDAPITPELLRLAEFAKMDYKATLAKCKKGDQQAIAEFFDFHRIVEEKSAVEHSLVCLDMIAASGDGNVAEVCKGLKDKLKVMVRERLAAAQPKSMKPELQKDMGEWAPKTWAALNNKILADPAREAAKNAEKAAKRQEGADASQGASEINASPKGASKNTESDGKSKGRPEGKGGQKPSEYLVPPKGGGQ